MIRKFFIFYILVLTSQVQAADKVCPEGYVPAEKGYWWNCEPIKEEKKEQSQIKLVPKPTSHEKKQIEKKPDDICTTAETYNPKKCGFINPDSLIKDELERLAFQRKMGEDLVGIMTMSPENASYVAAYQQYIGYIVDKAITAGRTARFNSVQNPSMSMSYISPSSAIGLRAMNISRQKRQESVFELIKEENGFVVLFTKESCDFCKTQAPIFKRFVEKHNFEYANIELEGDKCEKGFDKEHCATAVDDPRVIELVSRITKKGKKMFVPSTMVVLQDETNPSTPTLIYIGQGVTTVVEYEKNTANFVEGVKNAMAKGFAGTKDGQPAFRFEDKRIGSSEVNLGDLK